MPLSLTLDIAQVLEITEEGDRLTDLVNAEIRRRGGVPEDGLDALVYEILGDLCDYLRNREGGLPGGEMKTVVHTWIEDRLAEATA